MSAMTCINFARSFLTFRIDTLKKPPQTVSHAPPYSLNNARIQLDCVCDIVDQASNERQRFVLGVSCKTERVGVERDIWTTPNADFVPVLSADQFLNIKTYACLGQERDVSLFGLNRPQPDRQVGLTAEAFDRLTIHVREDESQRLTTAKEIIAATYDHRPLVARTEYASDRYQVRLEYPIKTFNVNERDEVYQTDTGPVLTPDLTLAPPELISGFQLAFAAFNSPNWIEFIVREPTQTPQGALVHHYSRPLRLDSVHNQIFALS
jgi:hypothetical protein